MSSPLQVVITLTLFQRKAAFFIEAPTCQDKSSLINEFCHCFFFSFHIQHCFSVSWEIKVQLAILQYCNFLSCNISASRQLSYSNTTFILVVLHLAWGCLASLQLANLQYFNLAIVILQQYNLLSWNTANQLQLSCSSATYSLAILQLTYSYLALLQLGYSYLAVLQRTCSYLAILLISNDRQLVTALQDNHMTVAVLPYDKLHFSFQKIEKQR